MISKKKILLYTYYPFFDKHLAGGVQVFMRKLAEELHREDFEINVLCPKSKNFGFAKGLNVYPVLEDIENDDVKPKSVYLNLKILEKYLDNNDLLWTIDRYFPIKTNKPIILSLNAICYEKELFAFFNMEWTECIFLSEYSRNLIKDYSRSNNNMQIIIPYIDSIFYKQKYCLEKIIGKYFEYNSDLKYILFPHRPEKEKGHFYAIRILHKLLKSDDSYRLLIPMPPISRKADVEAENNYINELKDEVKSLGVLDKVIFHNWIEYDDLPYYFSIGELSLFFSVLPETFGFSLVQSIGCGTPAISFGSGCLTETVPQNFGHIVIDKNKYMEAINIILNETVYENIEKGISFIRERYSLKRVVSEYKELFKKHLS
ncbi:MAG: glycosyltransferase family 4 protein [Fusobacteriaceae bacterium]|nr:glycosyltransferase family 4 protein [Fusobacteriaceae bacterium]